MNGNDPTLGDLAFAASEDATRAIRKLEERIETLAREMATIRAILAPIFAAQQYANAFSRYITDRDREPSA